MTPACVTTLHDRLNHHQYRMNISSICIDEYCGEGGTGTVSSQCNLLI